MTTETLPKPNTQLLRRILTGIASGELEHEQGDWHCGTAHCVAGWVEVFEAEKNGWKYDPTSESFYNDSKNYSDKPLGYRTEDVAVKILGLTFPEGYALFNGDATFAEQVLMLDRLEQGYRFYLSETVVELPTEAARLSDENIKEILNNPPKENNEAFDL